MLNTTVEIIDREKAKAYLETNHNNRPVDRAYVRQLASELEQGRFHETHQGIAFDAEGRLRDGQHRLLAIVASGVEAALHVTHGISEEAVQAIDQHRRRTAAQVLSMQAGIKVDAPRLTAMARTILQVVFGQARVSNNAAAAYAAENIELLSRYLRVAREFSPAVAAAFAWAQSLGWDEVQSAAERLVETMWTGPGDPMRALHTRAKSFRKGGGGVETKKRFDITLNALLAVHEDRELQTARTAQPDYHALQSKAPQRLSQLARDVQ
jgi:hypothetical protein